MVRTLCIAKERPAPQSSFRAFHAVALLRRFNRFGVLYFSEVSIGTTVVPTIFAIRTRVVPIMLAIRTTIVPIIFAIRATVDTTMYGQKENSIWFHNLYVKIGYKFLFRANNCLNSHDRRADDIGNLYDRRADKLC